MISPRTFVAASMHSRACFDEIRASSEPDEFTDDMKLIWRSLVTYYDNDSLVQTVATDVLLALVLSGQTNPKRRERLREAISGIESLTPPIGSVRESLRSARRDRLAGELSAALASGKAAKDVHALIAAYQEADSPLSAEQEEMTYAAALTQQRSAKGKIPILPKRLNDKLGGGAMPGHHITFFARPEMGKTAWALTTACAAAKRGHRVLYVGNEDAARDLMVRAVTCLTRKEREDITPEILEENVEALGRLVIKDIAPGTLQEITRLVLKHTPELLIVDQLRNISTDEDSFTRQLDKLAQGMRALAKRHDLVVVSITQAGASAQGHSNLTANDIDSSKTGIVGACDVLIGMGTGLGPDTRVLSLIKNKLTGEHNQVICRIDTKTSRVTSGTPKDMEKF